MQWLAGGRADYEHAIIGIEDGMIVEAQPGGGGMVAMHYRPARVKWSTGMPFRHSSGGTSAVGPLTGSLITAAARKYVGTPYSFADYAALAARAWHLPLPGLRDFVEDNHHQICSQLVDQCYQDAGIQLFDDGRWPGFVRPADLADLLAAPRRRWRKMRRLLAALAVTGALLAACGPPHPRPTPTVSQSGTTSPAPSLSPTPSPSSAGGLLQIADEGKLTQSVTLT